MLTRHAAANKDRLGGDAHAFQHRHYAFVAAIIRQMPYDDRLAVAPFFADRFQENPRFQRGRFLDAAIGGEAA